MFQFVKLHCFFKLANFDIIGNIFNHFNSDDVDHNEKSDEDNYDAEESHEVDYMSESDSESDVDLEKEKPDSAKRLQMISFLR